MSNYKRLPFSIIVLVVAFSLAGIKAFAQEKEQGQNSLKKDVWALQFEIDKNFTLSSFQGTIISAKRHFSPGKALRVGFGLSANFFESDEKDTETSDFSDSTSSERTTQTSQDNNRQQISIAVQYIVYPSNEKRINMFFGVGPNFGFTRSDSHSEREQEGTGNISPPSTDSNSKTWSIGASGVLGVEWFATPSISFLGEYGMTIHYSWSTIEATRIDFNNTRTLENKRSQNSFGAGAKTVRFGLSVYF